MVVKIGRLRNHMFIANNNITRGLRQNTVVLFCAYFYRRNTDKSNLTTRKERSSTMQVLNRLKMELSNQEYFTEEQYIQFLAENSLSPTDEYDKPTMQKQLLFTAIDVLEAVTVDLQKWHKNGL